MLVSTQGIFESMSFVSPKIQNSHIRLAHP